MNRLFFNKWTIITLRSLIGGVFIYSGATKLADLEQFAESIDSFQLLPDFLINLLAIGLPPVELLAGIMMLTGWHWRSANLLILILTFIFALALLQGITRGLQIDCGCFGSGKPTEWKTWASFGRDIMLFFGAFLTYLTGFLRFKEM